MAESVVADEQPVPVSAAAPGEEKAATPEVAAPPPPPAPAAAAPLDAARLKASATRYAADTAAKLKAAAAEVNAKRFHKDAARYADAVASLSSDARLAKLSPKAGPALKSAAPVVGKALAGGALLVPFLLIALALARDAAAFGRQHAPTGAAPLAWGLLLCFFGGDYVTLVAAAEAYRLCGGAAASAALGAVAAEARAVLSAAADVDAKDAAAAPPAAALRRKALLFARMARPEALAAAWQALWLTTLGVLATLKLRVARTTALAASLAAHLGPTAERHALPVLDAAVPAELRKWNAPAVAVALHSAALLLALALRGVLAALHSSLRGGALVAHHGLALLSARGLMKAADAQTEHALALGLAAVGLLTQAAAGFSVPFPLSLLTWPADLAEATLRWALALGPARA